MKKILLGLIIIGILISCNNDDDNSNTEIITENITISNSENYEYDLGGFGDEEGAGIKTQSEHFEISELERDFDTGQIIYKYKAETNYVGTEYVEITTGRGSDGASPNTQNTIVKITFVITE